MKKPYQLSLDEWEALLEKGPVRLQQFPMSIILEKSNGKYRYQRYIPGAVRFAWMNEITSDTLIGLVFEALFDSHAFADPLTVDADHEFVAMLSRR